MTNQRTSAAAIQLLVLDVDGVLTDGRLYYGARGEVMKVFDVKDGLGMQQLAAAGVTLAIISGRRSPAVVRRARDLGVRHVFQGVDDKLAVFERLRKRLGFEAVECACVGDDLPDVAMMQTAGLAFAVCDAHMSALRVADVVTSKPGGRGAVREVCDVLMVARHHDAGSARKATRK